MANQHSSVSVVIPVYNDAAYMHDCLTALQMQTHTPKEVIVVDNNCTDQSIAIAKTFSFVTIVKEKRQGLSFARNAGFEAASGDIILRIDADTYVPRDHIQKLIQKSLEYPDVAGFTGYGVTRNVSIHKISLLWSWSYFTFSHAYLGHPMLWGANMAFRRSYWKKVKPLLINNDMAVHEDQDFTLALASVGGKTAIFNDLSVSVNMKKLLEYSQYRKYGLMLHLLKILDKQHPRYNLDTRLQKTSYSKRVIYWFATILGVYGYYAVTIGYEVYRRIRPRTYS